MSATSRKQCFKCKQARPLTEFYVHPAMGDGRLNKCKECTRADVRANYRSNIGHYREYERARAMLAHRVLARIQYEQTEAGKAAMRRAHLRFIERNPEKRAAHVAVGNAIRSGVLHRCPCEVCGSPNTQAHHDDYGKPLDVRWLCSRHHREHHRKSA